MAASRGNEAGRMEHAVSEFSSCCSSLHQTSFLRSCSQPGSHRWRCDGQQVHPHDALSRQPSKQSYGTPAQPNEQTKQQQNNNVKQGCQGTRSKRTGSTGNASRKTGSWYGQCVNTIAWKHGRRVPRRTRHSLATSHKPQATSHKP